MWQLLSVEAQLRQDELLEAEAEAIERADAQRLAAARLQIPSTMVAPPLLGMPPHPHHPSYQGAHTNDWRHADPVFEAAAAHGASSHLLRLASSASASTPAEGFLSSGGQSGPRRGQPIPASGYDTAGLHSAAAAGRGPAPCAPPSGCARSAAYSIPALSAHPPLHPHPISTPHPAHPYDPAAEAPTLGSPRQPSRLSSRALSVSSSTSKLASRLSPRTPSFPRSASFGGKARNAADAAASPTHSSGSGAHNGAFKYNGTGCRDGGIAAQAHGDNGGDGDGGGGRWSLGSFARLTSGGGRVKKAPKPAASDAAGAVGKPAATDDGKASAGGMGMASTHPNAGLGSGVGPGGGAESAPSPRGRHGGGIGADMDIISEISEIDESANASPPLSPRDLPPLVPHNSYSDDVQRSCSSGQHSTGVPSDGMACDRMAGGAASGTSSAGSPRFRVGRVFSSLKRGLVRSNSIA